MPQSESKHSFFLQIKICGSIHFKDWRATPPVSHDAIILNYRFRDGFLFYMSLFLLFLRFGIQYRTKGTALVFQNELDSYRSKYSLPVLMGQ